jgi:thymidylate kinase
VRARSVGRLIVVEGLDACGKSTLAEMLARHLGGEGRPAFLLTRHTATERSGGYVTDHLTALRTLIWEYPPHARTSELGFGHWSALIGAWFHAVDHTLVRPLLATGTWVVADSWFHKFMARFTLQVGTAAAAAPFRGLTRPDSVLWLDVPPEECAHRRVEFRSTESGEWHAHADGFVDYQRRVRQVYVELAEKLDWERLPPADVEEVAAEAYARITGADNVGQRVAS